jgi:Arc/MetJ-type ribon-helix-helix transcriptional regulator
MASDLSPDTEAFIQRQVALGAFPTRSDALEAGITLLRKQRALIERLAASRRQLDEGDYEVFDDVGLHEFFELLIAQAESGAT